MSKPLTKKKAEELLKRIWFHHSKLSSALTAAHCADLIKYEDYKEQSPCKSLWEVGERIEKTTEKQIAEVVHRDIRSKIK